MKRGYVAFYAPVVWGRALGKGEYADVRVLGQQIDPGMSMGTRAMPNEEYLGFSG